jgi:hypothetical protein
MVTSFKILPNSQFTIHLLFDSIETDTHTPTHPHTHTHTHTHTNTQTHTYTHTHTYTKANWTSTTPVTGIFKKGNNIYFNNKKEEIFNPGARWRWLVTVTVQTEWLVAFTLSVIQTWRKSVISTRGLKKRLVHKIIYVPNTPFEHLNERLN